MTNIICNISVGTPINVEMNSGKRGESAYEVWLSLGNTGSKEDFIDSLAGGGGGTGTTNYNLLGNKPSIENVELVGNKTFDELGLQAISAEEVRNLF